MSDLLERLDTALGDRYRIERELGQGGMATVYRAEDLRHHRRVAIKVLKPELAAVLGADRFVQEITTTAQLQHPHILPLFDSGSADGFLYYVMPYVEGETLRDKLNRETQLGMVADFGIALALSAAAGGRMTETGMSLGTPHDMSPEQATADKDISARSDIYSLASVLYELLTGEPPHMGNSAQNKPHLLPRNDRATAARYIQDCTKWSQRMSASHQAEIARTATKRLAPTVMSQMGAA